MMDYTLQLHGEKCVYPVPNGLNELLSDIAREVLRAQPVNIVMFIADYLSALISFRESAKVAIDLVGDVLKKGKKSAKFFEDLGITEEEAIHAATVIQAAFRGFKVRMEMRRQREKEREGIIEPTEEEIEMINYLNERNLTFLQAAAAATIIQKVFRGYSARKKCDLRTFKALRWVRSHESWRHDWLWKEFGMTTADVQASLERKPTFVKYPEPTLPQRELEVDRLKLETLFEGQTEFISDSILSLEAPCQDREILEFKPESSVEEEEEEYEGELIASEEMEHRIEAALFKGIVPGGLEEWLGEYGGPPGVFLEEDYLFGRTGEGTEEDRPLSEHEIPKAAEELAEHVETEELVEGAEQEVTEEHVDIAEQVEAEEHVETAESEEAAEPVETSKQVDTEENAETAEQEEKVEQDEAAESEQVSEEAPVTESDQGTVTTEGSQKSLVETSADAVKQDEEPAVEEPPQEDEPKQE